MSSIHLATRIKIGMCLLNWEKRLNAFPRSTALMQVFENIFLTVFHDQTSVESLL